MHLVRGGDLSTAWARAARHLASQPGFQEWDLAVEIAQPLAEVGPIRAGIDRRLARRKKQSVETVANTIFPQLLSESSADRETLYRRYRAINPKLRRFGKNRRGLYFERLISWPPKADEPFNQLEAVIKRLGHELTLPGPKRFVYDLLLFSPDHDPLPIGFPCLAYVNVKIRDNKLCLLAHYRNHFFVERAYGNYLGLARLQRFIADAAGIEPGPLTCVSGHAELDDHLRPLLDWLANLALKDE